ncbi:AraC family transcriptional regulator [Neisseriaceae bacterium JH1-16]|nr:AraC family transcriptional regulator [Neisseriaceae bacterium JH1-16]
MSKVEPMQRGDDPLVERRVYQTAPDWHVHSYCQVLFGLCGQAELEMNGHLYRTRALSGVIVPAGYRHDFVGDADNCQLVVDLPVGSVAVPHVLLDKPREFAIPPQIDKALRLAVASGTKRRRQYDWLLAVEVIGQAVQALDGVTGDAATFPVRRIESFLRSRMDRPVSTATLAEQFGWKPRRFHDLFCEAFGDTPQHYQARLRLDRALQLLSDQALPLAEIAARLGYSDQQAFTRRFSARFGLPPGKWRNGH